MSDMATLTVSEVFGPTLQGEGPSAGRRCMFVRLGRCNLDCKWCDTPYTWDWTGKNGPPQDPKALRRMTVPDVLQHVQQLVEASGTWLPEMTVISGGEPMVQHGLLALADALASDGQRVEIETNGTIEPSAALASFCHFNVSPKLEHSGVKRELALNDDALFTFACLADAGRASFKFVARTPTDLHEVDALATRYGIPGDSIWIMPEGRNAAAIQAGLRNLAPHVLDRSYNLSGRMHVTIWEDRRGV